MPGAVVLDASVVISIAAREAATEATANTALAYYSSLGYQFFAPGVIISEVLYVLCGKRQDGSLSVADHAKAVQSFHKLMSTVLPSPQGDFSLILRSIRNCLSKRREMRRQLLFGCFIELL
jgi:predicted nucleic acid-binding protein